MKVTVLGANGAFSVGKHRDMIDVMDLDKIMQALKDPNVTVDEITKQFIKRAYIPTWQSNFLIEFPQVSGEIYRIVLDFGGDIRHSLENIGLNVNQINVWYCSHPHQDHIGGIECVALNTFFNPYFNKIKAEFLGGQPIAMVVDKKPLPGNCKPTLMAHVDVMNDIWSGARPGLETLEGIENVSLETYFNVHALESNETVEISEAGEPLQQDRKWLLKPVRSLHVVNNRNFMNSWGLMFEEQKENGQKIYFPTDSQFMSPKQIKTTYNKSTVIYQDCETSPFPSDVHAHITDLKTLSPEIKSKMLIYHYQETPTVGKHIDENEFKGVLKMGDVQEY